MPDLKTELKKLESIKFDDEGAAHQEITMHEPEKAGSVSATMFNIIRDNPGCSRIRLVSLASAAGIIAASSTSLITQFGKRGLVQIRESDGGRAYFATTNKYKPGYLKRAKPAGKVSPSKETDAAMDQPPKLQDTSVETLLNTLSISKARGLYDELKKIFGG